MKTSRLTPIKCGREIINCKESYAQDKMQQMFLKLGQLEDIEEELGIDLIILLKAQRYGIWFKHTSPFLEKEKPIIFSKGWHLEYNEPTNRYYLELGSAISSFVGPYAYLWEIVEFKDYGKTWALTKEELEQ